MTYLIEDFELESKRANIRFYNEPETILIYSSIVIDMSINDLPF